MFKAELLYIDDLIDPELSKYLDGYNYDGIEVNYKELKFLPEDGYNSLISNSDVRCADVIIIDSDLFQDRLASNGKFLGEEFKIIMKRFFPLTEVMVVSQHGENQQKDVIAKYNINSKITADEYYNQNLKNKLDKFIYDNIVNSNLLNEFIGNTYWNNDFKNRILEFLKGQNEYESLKKEDIDKLIISFEELRRKIDG